MFRSPVLSRAAQLGALFLLLCAAPGVLAAGSSTAPRPPSAQSAEATRTSANRISLTGSRVRIYNLAGRLELVAGTGSAVLVEYEPKGKDAAKLDPQFPNEGGEPNLIIRYPSDRIVYRDLPGNFRSEFSVAPDGRFGGDTESEWKHAWKGMRRVQVRNSGEGLEAWADLKVHVPKGQRIDAHLGVGEVLISNVDGELFIDCASAGISSNGTRGKLLIDTGSGTVSVNDAEGPLSVDTGSGSVEITKASGKSLIVDSGSGSVSMSTVRADNISIDTGSGSVEVSDARCPRVHVDTGSGWVRMRLLETVEDVLVDSGSGSVTIEAPDNLSASLSFETGSGDIETDFPLRITRKESDSLSGTIGEGKGRIVVETGSGSFTLRRL